MTTPQIPSIGKATNYTFSPSEKAPKQRQTSCSFWGVAKAAFLALLALPLIARGNPFEAKELSLNDTSLATNSSGAGIALETLFPGQFVTHVTPEEMVHTLNGDTDQFAHQIEERTLTVEEITKQMSKDMDTTEESSLEDIVRKKVNRKILSKIADVDPKKQYKVSSKTTIMHTTVEADDAARLLNADDLFVLANQMNNLKQFEKAAKWYQVAAEKGHPGGNAIIGKMYLFGEHITQDFDLGAKYLDRASKLGGPEIQKGVGQVYLLMSQNYVFGENGYPKDIDIAMKWLNKADACGEPRAKENIAYINANYILIGDKYREKLGDIEIIKPEVIGPSGFYSIGVLYRHQGDKDKANKMFKEAADRGHAEASYLVGLGLYDGGKGTKEERKLSIHYLNQAAYQKHDGAITLLGLIYLEGDADAQIERNWELGLEYLDKAVTLGKAYAANSLGEYHRDGAYGLEKNPEQAFHYFSIAAEKGDTKAQRNLADLYSTGDGVEKDLKKAAYWRQKADSKPVAA